MSNGHARLGPSNHRWPNCPGSVREEAAYPDIPGEAAIDGTGTHLLLELALTNGVRADQYIDQIIGEGHEDSPMGWIVDRDRADRVQMCLDYLVRRDAELSAEFPGANIIIESESKSDPGQRAGRDDWWGTVDITITAEVDGRPVFIEVIDYKDGRGWVHADDNTQLQSYLIGKVGVYPESVEIDGRMTIVQPKTKPVVRCEFIAACDLAPINTQLIAAAAATDSPDAPLIPDGKLGKGYCRWCKHKVNCSALTESLTTGITTMNSLDVNLFTNLDNAISSLSTLPDTQLAELADTEEAVKKIYEKIKTELILRLERGDDIPGWAMLPGRGSKLWAQSEEETEKALKSRRFLKKEIYPTKLISPAQALKHPKLTKTQREKMEKDLIVFKAGTLTPTKVAVQEKDPATMFLADPEVSFM